MMRIRKCLAFLCCMTILLTMQGCSSEKSKTSSKQNGQTASSKETSKENGKKDSNQKSNKKSKKDQKISKEEYLDLKVINEKVKKEDKYKTYTVTRGTFENGINNAQGGFWFPKGEAICSEHENGTLIFEKFLVNNYTIVKPGTPIASVHMDIDPTELEEKQVKLDREKLRHQHNYDQYKKQLSECEKHLRRSLSQAERLETKLQYDDLKSNWVNTEEDYQKTIKDMQKDIDEYHKLENTKELVSKNGGYVMIDENPVKAGQEIKKDQQIAYVMQLSPVYVQVDNKNELLSYGQDVSVTMNGPKNGIKGKVVSVDSKTTSYDLHDNMAYIALDPSYEIKEYRNVSVSYITQSMKDALLVDREAVTETDDGTFVHVLNDDGTITKTSFTSGGDNPDYYWVLSGLEEGMKLVKVE